MGTDIQQKIPSDHESDQQIEIIPKLVIDGQCEELQRIQTVLTLAINGLNIDTKEQSLTLMGQTQGRIFKEDLIELYIALLLTHQKFSHAMDIVMSLKTINNIFSEDETRAFRSDRRGEILWDFYTHLDLNSSMYLSHMGFSVAKQSNQYLSRQEVSKLVEVDLLQPVASEDSNKKVAA